MLAVRLALGYRQFPSSVGSGILKSVEHSRRKLLFGAASILGLAALVKARGLEFGSEERSDFAVNGLLRGGVIQRPKGFSRSYFYPSTYFLNSEVFQIDVRNLKAISIPTRSPPHVVETHPIERHLSVAGTQKSDTIALLDWNSGRELISRTHGSDLFYYGHSVFSERGDKVLSTVYNRTSWRNFVEVLDSSSFKVIEEIEIDRGIVHEIKNLGNDQYIFGVASQAANLKPAIGVLNLVTKGIEYTDVPFANQPNVFSHIYVNGQNVYADIFEDSLRSYQRLPGNNSQLARILNLNLSTKAVSELKPTIEQQISSQALSLAVDRIENTLWVSFPDASKIQVWSLKEAAILETLNLNSEQAPRGVAFDAESGRMLISTQKSVLFFNSKSRKLITELAMPRSGYCAHLRFS